MKCRIGFLGLAGIAGLLAIGSCSTADDGDAPIFTADGLTKNPTNVAALTACGGKTPDHIVKINDFAYSPMSLTVKAGETVAWVNEELCGDTPAEATAVPLSGCDTHHEVVTFPATPGGENVDSGDICSPNRGVLPSGGIPPGFPIDTGNCADANESNAWCHTFTQTGTQHYTCFTNPGHTLLLNGFITVVDD